MTWFWSKNVLNYPKNDRKTSLNENMQHIKFADNHGKTTFTEAYYSPRSSQNPWITLIKIIDFTENSNRHRRMVITWFPEKGWILQKFIRELFVMIWNQCSVVVFSLIKTNNFFFSNGCTSSRGINTFLRFFTFCMLKFSCI